MDPAQLGSNDMQVDQQEPASQPSPVIPPGYAQCSVCKKLFKEKGVRSHMTQKHGRQNANMANQQDTSSSSQASETPQTTPSSQVIPDSSAASGHTHSPPSTPAPARKKKKSKCKMCGTFVCNIRRHLQGVHPALWESGLTVQQMYDKATPFPDLDGDEMDLDDDGMDDMEIDEQYEVLEPTSSDAAEESDCEASEDDQNEHADQANSNLPPVTEKVRHGWMSFGRD